MAAVAVPSPRNLPRGLKDSKLLSAARRDVLFEKLQKCTHSVRIIWPPEIDEWVFQNRLNWLEAKYTVELIQELQPSKVIVDCPSRNVQAYQDFLSARCDAVVHACHHADRDFRVVSAASIIAKVTRDRIIEDLKAQLGVDFGSGYLTDPKTQAFLTKENMSYEHIRKSWSTYKVLVSSFDQTTLR